MNHITAFDRWFQRAIPFAVMLHNLLKSLPRSDEELERLIEEGECLLAIQ